MKLRTWKANKKPKMSAQRDHLYFERRADVVSKGGGRGGGFFSARNFIRRGQEEDKMQEVQAAWSFVTHSGQFICISIFVGLFLSCSCMSVLVVVTSIFCLKSKNLIELDAVADMSFV